MKFKILLLAISAAVITSCNTAYKSGQTPDDVYYSPARVIEEDTQKEEPEKNDVATAESIDERELRMQVRDRRWRDLDNSYECNCSCDYTPYSYGYNHGYYYNPFYNPYPVYTSGTAYTNPKTPVRMSNLNSYNAVKTTQVVNVKTGKTEYVTRPASYNNSNTTKTREISTPSNNNTRTYTPSSTRSSGSSSGSSSSGAGRSVSRPSRN